MHHFKIALYSNRYGAVVISIGNRMHLSAIEE